MDNDLGVKAAPAIASTTFKGNHINRYQIWVVVCFYEREVTDNIIALIWCKNWTKTQNRNLRYGIEMFLPKLKIELKQIQEKIVDRSNVRNTKKIVQISKSLKYFRFVLSGKIISNKICIIWRHFNLEFK